MFEGSTARDLLTAAEEAAGVDAIGAWARVEAVACARRLALIAEFIEARMAADGTDEREQWCLDNWDAVATEVAVALSTTPGVAANQMLHAVALRDRLPRVAAVFAAGAISYRLVMAIVSRTFLIQDPGSLAKVDTELAARIIGWKPMSATRTELEIDALVDRYDPGALRRTELRARGRCVELGASDGSGTTSIWGSLYSHDATALDRRLDAIARGVCAEDPRTLDQRRADAMGALAAGKDRLSCLCGNVDCPAAADERPATTVIHVVAESQSVTDQTRVALDGVDPEPIRTSDLNVPLSELLRAPAGTGPSQAPPGLVIGGGILPAPLVAELARNATIRPIVHPGASPPEPHYRPSRALADFVRCRDLTCRFPGCDCPADACDIDHTIPYELGGLTHASNLKCMCRRNHLLKTFWGGPGGWRDRQYSDGTVGWTSPSGHTYITRPGSALLFPALCAPTGELESVRPEQHSEYRGTMMPKRRRTRAQDRAYRIAAERKLNNAHVAEHDEPPPF
jgi:hypothetical protein